MACFSSENVIAKLNITATASSTAALLRPLYPNHGHTSLYFLLISNGTCKFEIKQKMCFANVNKKRFLRTIKNFVYTFLIYVMIIFLMMMMMMMMMIEIIKLKQRPMIHSIIGYKN